MNLNLNLKIKKKMNGSNPGSDCPFLTFERQESYKYQFSKSRFDPLGNRTRIYRFRLERYGHMHALCFFSIMGM